MKPAKIRHPATGTKMVQFRLTAEDARKIKLHCVLNGVTLAAFGAAALHNAMEKQLCRLSANTKE